MVPDAEFQDALDALISELASGPTLSYARSKRAINASTLTELGATLESEREGQAALLRSLDFAEGVTAFRAKRTPTFTGNR